MIDTYNISSSLRDLLWKLEILVAIFILEYVLRLYGAPNRLAYVRDIYSIIDLVAIMPTMILMALPASFFIYDIRGHPDYYESWPSSVYFGSSGSSPNTIFSSAS